MSYFKSDNKYIYLDTSYAEFYIPLYYFEASGDVAIDMGDIIKALGIFEVGFFENGKLKEMKTFNLPTWTEFFVYDSEDRDVPLPGNNGNTTPCRVVKYLKGQKIMNAAVIEDSSNAETFLNFIIRGKLPTFLKYEDAIKIWRKNQELNSVHLGVPSVIQELVLSNSYRYKGDQNKKFSHVIGKDTSISQYDYIMNNIRQICQYTSTFTALTFEDLDSMVTTSLNRTRLKTDETESPLEDLIKL